MATFSFYAAHLICCGEGGMVSTDNPEVAYLLKSVKSHGRKPDSLYFDHLRFGLNFKMNDLWELNRFTTLLSSSKLWNN